MLLSGLQTYAGSCHCRRIQFQVVADIDHVRICDCSICHRRGALMYRVSKGNLRLLTSWNDLCVYQWGSRTAKDYFCPLCGILPFQKPSAPTLLEIAEGVESFDGWAINVRCLEGINADRLPRRQIMGSLLALH
jgi:hypothetical protein